MKPIILFVDALDLYEAVKAIDWIIQARKEGLIDKKTPLKVVTNKEFPCNGNYALGAIRLKAALVEKQNEYGINVDDDLFPVIIPGSVSPLFTYNETEKKYIYNSLNAPDEMHSNNPDNSYLLNEQWSEVVAKAAEHGAHLLNKGIVKNFDNLFGGKNDFSLGESPNLFLSSFEALLPHLSKFQIQQRTLFNQFLCSGDEFLKAFISEIAFSRHELLLDADFLNWANGLYRYVQITGQTFTNDVTTKLTTELQKKASLDDTKKALKDITCNYLRKELLPKESLAYELLLQKGALQEFKRTGNSLMYAHMALKKNLDVAFPVAIKGMTQEYKDLVQLTGKTQNQIDAFLLHLALHDAGKGTVISEAVHKNEEGVYFVKLDDKNYYSYDALKNDLQKCDQIHFVFAKTPVDHDNALCVYAKVGGNVNDCSPTEYLLWKGKAPKNVDPKVIEICDELIPLCNEMNIAQTIQGEIPFIGIKKGLDLFFEAYEKSTDLADLIFAHHCWDIMGTAPADSFSSASGSDPKTHLKIKMLHNILLNVANDASVEKSNKGKTAFDLYRLELAKAIPRVLNDNDIIAHSPANIAYTRIAQMLRCNLFETTTDANTKEITRVENETQKEVVEIQGTFDSRTQAFVAGIKAAFEQLEHSDLLIEQLNQNDKAVMIMYSPKLLLTAVLGNEHSSDIPSIIDITERLTPVLNLCSKIYTSQEGILGNKDYDIIDVNLLSLIMQSNFDHYSRATAEQKEMFVELLYRIQMNGLQKLFHANLDTKAKTSTEQVISMQNALINSVDFSAPTCAGTMNEVLRMYETSILEKPNKSELQQFVLKKIAEIKVPSVKDKTSADAHSTYIQHLQHLDNVFMNLQKVPELNAHRNPRKDEFFGIKNTESWRDCMAKMREQGLKRLAEVVDATVDNQEKLELLAIAKKLPLFNQHRNNSIFAGAWGKTSAIRKIEKMEEDCTTMSCNI